jgi:hypothetical protein
MECYRLLGGASGGLYPSKLKLQHGWTPFFFKHSFENTLGSQRTVLNSLLRYSAFYCNSYHSLHRRYI